MVFHLHIVLPCFAWGYDTYPKIAHETLTFLQNFYAPASLRWGGYWFRAENMAGGPARTHPTMSSSLMLQTRSLTVVSVVMSFQYHSMETPWNRCTMGYPQIIYLKIDFHDLFHFKSSFWWHHHVRKPHLVYHINCEVRFWMVTGSVMTNQLTTSNGIFAHVYPELWLTEAYYYPWCLNSWFRFFWHYAKSILFGLKGSDRDRLNHIVFVVRRLFPIHREVIQQTRQDSI